MASLGDHLVSALAELSALTVAVNEATAALTAITAAVQIDTAAVDAVTAAVEANTSAVVAVTAAIDAMSAKVPAPIGGKIPALVTASGVMPVSSTQLPATLQGGKVKVTGLL